MRISLNWLRKYIDIQISPNDLADRLTMIGFEVENIEHLGAKYDRFVVGEVFEVQKHPNADKLTVCKVGIGTEVLQIVCGAPNVKPFQKVAVGLTGARIPHNQHDPDAKPFFLSQAKIRGVDSYGMICSAFELGIGDDKNGILELAKNAKPGLPLADYLGINDTILEVGITPNRPDAMSHIGIAREIGALLEQKVNTPSTKVKESKKGIGKYASVRVEDKQNCPRYTARVILGVKIASSPEWLKESLNAIGIRPINNVVDITNYVLMECGHPLHAFDYDKLDGHTIVVRLARKNEFFTTLDHKNRELRDDILMVCDAAHPVAIAGIMGGENSEISESTVNVFLESAYFRPQSIRKSAKYFGLSTDASQRFERGADPSITPWAVDRAARLIQDICGGEILRGKIDSYPKKISPRKITLRVGKTNEVLGIRLSAKRISSLLNKLNIEVLKSNSKGISNKSLTFRIPTFRPDIEREIDLIEEVARLHGYNNIETKNFATIQFSEGVPKEDITDIIRKELTGFGMREVVANSMQQKSVASLASDKIVEIANPISKDMSSLRTSLIPGMLSIIRHNIYHGTKNLRLFEIGRVYFHAPGSVDAKMVEGYTEDEHLLLTFTGVAQPLAWDQKPRFVDVFDVKGELQSLFDKISLDKIKYIPYPNTKALTENGLIIEINGEYVGSLGSVRREILDRFEVEQDVFIAELRLDVLSKHVKTIRRDFRALPKYPAVRRDLAVVLDSRVPVGGLEEKIWQSGQPLLTDLELFDIYIGDQIPSGKKSCAFALEFLSEDHTLAQEEVDDVIQNIIDQTSRSFGAEIRK
ncbi:MAG: phenylalanine--tRNA ligase subunit beta [Ignavibacteria bacterium]|nr:phenylalanine--tRNA ligase subunit beta [Ignavibacteria bacterium]